MAKEFELSRTTIYQWMAKPKDRFDNSSKAAKNLKITREGEFTLIDTTLKTYMLDTIQCINGISLLREDVIGSLSFEFRGKLLIPIE